MNERLPSDKNGETLILGPSKRKHLVTSRNDCDVMINDELTNLLTISSDEIYEEELRNATEIDVYRSDINCVLMVGD